MAPPATSPISRGLRTPAGSAIGTLLARHDWRDCPLGAPDSWPAALTIAYAAALHSPLPIALVWGEQFTTLYNDAYVGLLGDRHPAAFGQAFDAIWHDYRDNVRPLLEAAFAGRASHLEDVPYLVTRDGIEVDAWVDYTCTPLFDQSGAVRGMQATCTDSTARVLLARAADQEVRKARTERDLERRMVQLVDSLPQLAWIADGAGRALWFNQRFQDYTGLDQATLLARDWQGLLPLEERGVVAARWREALDGAHPFVATVRLGRPDGELRTFFATAVPIEGSGGAFEQWFGTCTDVSSLQQTQEALRVTQEWLQQGLSTGKMVVWDYYPDSGQIRYSENAGEVLGYAHDHIENSFRHVHEDDMPGLREAMRRTIEDGALYHHTSRRINPASGQVKWIEQRGKVVSAPGAPLRMVGVNIDVTERVLAENQLHDANRRKDEFLAMLAHELRNPLAPLSAAAHLLQHPGMGAAQVARTSDIIARQVAHMTKLLDDLLDVSRVTRGLVTLQRQPVDLKAVAASAIEQVQPLIDSRRHHFEARIGAAPAMVLGDQVRLVQVLANLLNNACRYTPPGGRIELSVDAEGEQVVVTVADNGVGIDDAFLPEIFDLFSQGERSADRSQGGLGLGLALVRTMVELHQGRVRAASPGRGRGSSFELRLPLLEREDDAAPGMSAAAQEQGRRLRIAIVDDNADAANLIGVALEMEGHEVMTFYDPLRFIDDARLQGCDAFVLDIGLPGMDGYQLARRLRARDDLAGALIIALSGYGQETDVQRAVLAGFDVHLTKPVSLDVLLQQLARAG